MIDEWQGRFSVGEYVDNYYGLFQAGLIPIRDMETRDDYYYDLQKHSMHRAGRLEAEWQELTYTADKIVLVKQTITGSGLSARANYEYRSMTFAEAYDFMTEEYPALE